MIELIIALGAGTFGYFTSKDFAKRKLRFVDAIHTRPAPFVAGAAVAVAAAPVVWVLPVVGAGTAILLGAGVGLGVHSAQKERNRLE